MEQKNVAQTITLAGAVSSEVITSLEQIAASIDANTQAVREHAEAQHQRNRLAAMTAHHRGLELPADLMELVTEGRKDWER